MRSWMRWRPLTSAIALSAAVAVVGVVGASAMSSASHNRQRGSVILAGVPGNPVADPQTHTLYVPIQCSNPMNCGPSTAEHVMEIIDTSKCDTGTVSGCRVVGRAQAGKGPLAAVVDQKTDTIYVMDGSGAVTVVDGAGCNATVRTHCQTPLATIATGGFDVAGALDSRTHTLYVAAPSGDVFVINVARCNAKTTTGCHQQVKAVKDTLAPDGIDVDLATNTVYAANGGPTGNGNTVSVINGAMCSGLNGSGCGATPPTITVGGNPFWVTVDQATNTVYVPNFNDGTVSIIDGSACNATATAGCHRKPRAISTGGEAAFTAIDQRLHTLFVINHTDGTLSEINTKTCNGHTQSGCPARARNEHVRFNPAKGENPGAFALVSATGTAYMVNVGGGSFLAAYNVTHCDALTTAGCRVEAPSVRAAVAFPVVDPATDTIYAGSTNHPGILVLNGATCNAKKLSDCKPVATIPFAHPQANVGSIDRAVHTLYAADTFSDTVSAINIQHCNADDTSGCGATAPKMTIGIGPGIPQLNPATHTLYVPEGVKTSSGYNFNQIAVLNAATCNAVVTSGCGQPPATVIVGQNAYVLAVSAKTNTVYSAVEGPSSNSRSVWVIDGAACNATDHSGCASAVVARAGVGLDPAFVAVDDATHSAYVSNNANGVLPGTVSIINVATCNGTSTTSCSGAKPTVRVGRSPIGIAIDTTADRIYVADYSAAAVSVIDGSRCAAGAASGCAKPAPEVQVASEPFVLFLNPRTRSVYVTTRWGPTRRLSIFATSP